MVGFKEGREVVDGAEDWVAVDYFSRHFLLVVNKADGEKMERGIGKKFSQGKSASLARPINNRPFTGFFFVMEVVQDPEGEAAPTR